MRHAGGKRLNADTMQFAKDSPFRLRQGETLWDAREETWNTNKNGDKLK